MKSDKINFNLLLGFIVSIFVHIVIFTLINSYKNNEQVVESKKDSQTKLSLSMFKEAPSKPAEVISQVKTKQEKKISKKVVKTIKKAEQKPTLHEKNEQREKKEVEKIDTFEEEKENKMQEVPRNTQAHFDLIKKALDKYSKYPDIDKSLKKFGKTSVKFTLDKDGKVIDSWVFKSSGYSIFDKHALEVVGKASVEFPKLEEVMTFTFIVSYE